jgi:MFS family permease
MSKLKQSLFPISSLFFAISFLAIGYGMILTYVGVYLKELGVSNMTIGIINASFFLGAILSSILSQSIISKVGHIRSFAAFAAIMVVSFLLHSIYYDQYLWGILRFLSGFAYYGLLIILESWLNEKSDSDDRGKILAIYTIIFYLSTAIGQLLLNINEKFTESIFTIGSILVLISIVFISLTKIKEPVLEPFEKYSIPKIYSLVPLASTSSFIGGFLVGGFFTMIPVYLIIEFNSVEVVSYFMLITLLGGLISQWPIGLLSDKYGRRKMIAYCAQSTTFVSLFFLFFSFNTTMVYIFGFLLGLTIFSIYPLGVARANDVMDENKDILEISRTLLFTYGIGSFIAPLVIGFSLSINSNFLFIIFALLGIYLSFYSLSKKRIDDDNLSIFINIPVISGTKLVDFDPRQEEIT